MKIFYQKNLLFVWIVFFSAIYTYNWIDDEEKKDPAYSNNKNDDEKNGIKYSIKYDSKSEKDGNRRLAFFQAIEGDGEKNLDTFNDFQKANINEYGREGDALILATKFINAGDFQNAQNLLGNDISLRLHNNEFIAIEKFHELRSILIERGRGAEYMPMLISLPENNPDRSALIAEHAIFSGNNGNVEAGESVFREGLVGHEKDVDLLKSYSDFLVFNGKETQAKEVFKSIVSQ